ncbi:DUF262 domain-containing HNH endonuclease family protein [Acinetobacter lwoffii]|uniref:DUF262 domain-containing protein n=1 Tax=Acinetobacter lwoffii TaxID=28090 RepID=UPI00209B04B8|nr:DUF262 domain-containing protein [Acinetobacter lwoffii]MCO8115052.1 DUF262 domain-containing HNH endonuclease family protein [Acinetobacter lwoffii]
MLDHNELTLKTINDLLTMSFFIPAYQRGYRWSARQVIELLEDVYEFCDRKIKVDEDFYCLQPVVVKQRGEQWELVDGQQRLTTILLILGYFNSRFAEDFRKQLYTLEYETRPESREYLVSLDENKRDQNIDFHFIFEAYSNIRAWFKDKVHRINDIESVFLNKVKIIWYQLAETENVTDVFTRLNMGKIPLVNAELVKALFLKSSNFSSAGQTVRHLQQLNIAQEWDAIEKRLQDDAFWYFVSNQPIASNRIEFVLALAARRLSSEGILEHDKLKVFLQFNKQLQNNDNEVDVVKEWLKIKQCFMTLEEWFNDKALFHLVGYLVSQKVAVETIFDLSETCKSKYAFRQNLIEQIFVKTFANKNLNDVSKALIEAELSELNYETDAKKIRSILLLFNIASLLANPITNSRFQFNKYKQDNWDIEHIRSVASDMPRDKNKQIKWLENVVDYISDVNTIHIEERSTGNSETSHAIKKDATELVKTDFNDQQFEAIYLRILSFYDPGGNNIVDNSIGNLTLLDSTTNRSYKNAVFPIKRSKIIALDKEATFVPLCTKNVFLKYYSKQVDKMLYWESKDSQDHQQAMIHSLYGIFCGEGVHI